MLVGSLGQEDPLEKEMATHPRTLAWEIPWTEEPGELHSVESQSQIQLGDRACMHGGEKEQQEDLPNPFTGLTICLFMGFDVFP